MARRALHDPGVARPHLASCPRLAPPRARRPERSPEGLQEA
jgi:hypothetical protein